MLVRCAKCGMEMPSSNTLTHSLRCRGVAAPSAPPSAAAPHASTSVQAPPPVRPIADASTPKPDTGLHSSGCSGIPAASTNHTSAAAGGSGSEQLRCRVDSDSTVLQLLHEVYKWVPGEANVRPTPEVRAQKELLLANLDGMWASPADWVYHHVFGMTTARGANGKRSCVSRPDAGTTVFARNPFPYAVPNGTEHFVFWMASNEAEWPEQRITDGIAAAIDARGGGQFVWYPNPKMSVPDPQLFHVQVFWKPTPQR